MELPTSRYEQPSLPLGASRLRSRRRAEGGTAWPQANVTHLPVPLPPAERSLQGIDPAILHRTPRRASSPAC
jgi:hypothetical protein